MCVSVIFTEEGLREFEQEMIDILSDEDVQRFIDPCCERYYLHYVTRACDVVEDGLATETSLCLEIPAGDTLSKNPEMVWFDLGQFDITTYIEDGD